MVRSCGARHKAAHRPNKCGGGRRRCWLFFGRDALTSGETRSSTRRRARPAHSVRTAPGNIRLPRDPAYLRTSRSRAFGGARPSEDGTQSRETPEFPCFLRMRPTFPPALTRPTSGDRLTLVIRVVHIHNAVSE